MLLLHFHLVISLHSIDRSDVSAMSDSDVGDQQMLITVSTNFQNFVDVPFLSAHAVDIQSMNVFLCLPLARLPSIIPVSATASNWFFLITWPTNRICMLTITFRRFLDVLALWRTLSLDTLSVHDIRNIRRKNHISTASNCDSILLLIVQLSHPYNKVDHT